MGMNEVDAYLAGLGQPHRSTLDALRATLRKLLPHAEEGIKYGMPAVLLHGKGVAGYAAFTGHCSYFPMSGSVLDRAGDVVARYTVSKGGLQFPADRPLATGVVRRLVELRLGELGAAVRNGRRYEYHPDGAVKATGMVKDGERHGTWSWYRRDGSLMRTAEFRRGEEVDAT